MAVSDINKVVIDFKKQVEEVKSPKLLRTLLKKYDCTTIEELDHFIQSLLKSQREEGWV